MAKRYISLAVQNALVYFLLFIGGITLLSIIFLSYSSIEIRELTDKRLKHTQEMVQLKFETNLEQLVDDINQLSYSPLLKQYLISSDIDVLNILHNEHSSFLKSKQHYFQIRLLSTDIKGKEILRVERINSIIKRCPEEELQYKGERDYFQELMQLPPDSIYYSKIDLNKENGQLSDPRIPTLRIAKKVAVQNGRECILIANVDLTMVFNNLKALIPDSHEFRLFNQDGHYLIHPIFEQTFTFESGQPSFFPSEYSLNIDKINYNGTTLSDEYAVNLFFKVKYGRPGYKLFGGISVKDKVEFASFYIWRRKMILISVFIAVLFLVAAFIYMRKQAKDLKNITEELKLFSLNIKPKQSIIQRNDEIGELSTSFESMSQKIYDSHVKLKIAKSKAEAAHQEKEAFLENMSHEIRNPLQSILGGVQILEQNKKLNQQQPFINSIKFNTHQLHSLVTDVLDFDKLRGGLIHLNNKWLELKPFCLELIATSKYRADKKNITVNLDFSEALEMSIFKFDQIRLYQIINNLLTNAIKFTPENGTITVNVSALENKLIRFSIIDNGAGMNANEIELLRQRKIGTNYNSGAGLGLAIVQELLQLYDSSLQIVSELDKGSTFSFDLLLERKIRTSNKTIANELSVAQMKGISVLALEDDAELRQWYSYIFQHANMTLCATPNELKNHSINEFDFIVCDLNFGTYLLSTDEIKKTLLPLLKSQGKLIVISGSDVNLSIKQVAAFKKPVTKEDLLTYISEHQLGILHDIPDFSNIEKDYDFNQSLIKNAITILIKAWENDKNAILTAVANDDRKSFHKIQHRIISTIRRLNLYSFESYLENIDFSEGNKDKLTETISEKMTFYISKMKVYLNTLK